MFLDLLLFAACAAVGLRLQVGGHGDGIRARLWQVNFVVLIPIAASFAFLTLDLDTHVLRVVAVAVSAWWITVLVAGAHGRLVTRDRPRQGALWLVGAFPNTGFIGFPLAHLAFGTDGLRLAIVYDQVSLLVPAVVVSTVIASRHTVDPGSVSPGVSVLREMATSPPLLTVLVLLGLRATVLRDPIELEWLGDLVGTVVGPVGFLLLGLSIPLGGFTHDRREVAETVGAVLVRIVVAPLLVFAVARMTDVDVPDSLYLIAAMPTAFHALVLSRLHDLEPAIVRLGVLVSSTVVVLATVIWVSVG